MLFHLLRPHPTLVARFAAASLGRAALTAVSILLIREFLAGVLGHQQGFAERVGIESALWLTVALLLLASLGAAAFNYDSQVSQQKIVKAIELGTMERLIRHLLGLSVGFLDRRTHGELLKRVSLDV
jgi:ABC-type multidrug transport system fused ATPase/permease subunit